MDFSHAIQFGGGLTTSVGSIANIKDEDVFGLFPEFRKRLSQDAVRHYASILGGVSRSQMEDAVGLVPHQWQLDSPVRSALASYLFQRASFVAEIQGERTVWVVLQERSALGAQRVAFPTRGVRQSDD